MERPDSVSRAAPPTSTMRKTRLATVTSQKRTTRRSSKLAVCAAAGALWIKAMRDVRRVSGTVRQGAKPAFCLKQVEGATPRGRRRIASRGHSVADWLRGSQESRSKFSRRQIVGKNRNLCYSFYLDRI